MSTKHAMPKRTARHVLPKRTVLASNKQQTTLRHRMPAYVALGTLWLAFALLFTAPLAFGDPVPNGMDPHVPNFGIRYCPGGKGGFAVFWCDGEHYPDGTYWHQTMGYTSPIGTLTCVADNDSPMPPIAPPGGCGGAQV